MTRADLNKKMNCGKYLILYKKIELKCMDKIRFDLVVEIALARQINFANCINRWASLLSHL